MGAWRVIRARAERGCSSSAIPACAGGYPCACGAEAKLPHFGHSRRGLFARAERGAGFPLPVRPALGYLRARKRGRFWGAWCAVATGYPRARRRCCVGSPRWRVSWRPGYPRGRGEWGVGVAAAGLPGGLSPRARGVGPGRAVRGAGVWCTRIGAVSTGYPRVRGVGANPAAVDTPVGLSAHAERRSEHAGGSGHPRARAAELEWWRVSLACGGLSARARSGAFHPFKWTPSPRVIRARGAGAIARGT